MKKLLLGAGASALLLGCASAPKDLGYGRYAEVTTMGGSMYSQALYANEIDCELSIRTAWRNLQNNGLTARCITTDKSAGMPYTIHVRRSTYKAEAKEFWFATPAGCGNMRDFFERQNADITARCSL